MICPLCKAEYRPEFNLCTDCNLRLVRTAEEARRPVVVLWHGHRPGVLRAIIEELVRAGIPHNARPVSKPLLDGNLEQRAHGRALHFLWPFLLWRFFTTVSTPEYEVRIFSSDLESAREKVAHLL